MHVLPVIGPYASLFDPSDNGFDIADVATILGVITATVLAFAGLARAFASLVRRIVREELAVWTAPIQRGANGGYSLPDVARTSDWNRQALKAIADAHGIALPPDPNDRSH